MEKYIRLLAHLFRPWSEGHSILADSYLLSIAGQRPMLDIWIKADG
jgi:hypothetical protein